jgi:hypothetical protein
MGCSAIGKKPSVCSNLFKFFLIIICEIILGRGSAIPVRLRNTAVEICVVGVLGRWTHAGTALQW